MIEYPAKHYTASLVSRDLRSRCTVSFVSRVLANRDFRTRLLTKESTFSNTKQIVVSAPPQRGQTSILCVSQSSSSSAAFIRFWAKTVSFLFWPVNAIFYGTVELLTENSSLEKPMDTSGRTIYDLL